MVKIINMSMNMKNTFLLNPFLPTVQYSSYKFLGWMVQWKIYKSIFSLDLNKLLTVFSFFCK